ncbi:hypothetical protein DS837_31525 [Azospirillum brasilense]|uniref:Uncharacterized protein n=1 Tax=Azospirillum brasilense TaxID=192 RepID=A0A6L3AQW3_AZOBR|nr:hypothetical protein DS837_31525 [Azospirillum brasilense]
MSSLASTPRIDLHPQPPPVALGATPELWAALPMDVRRRIVATYAAMLVRMSAPRPRAVPETHRAERGAPR